MFYLHGDEKSVHFCETQASRHGSINVAPTQVGFSYSQGRSDCVILKWRYMNMPAGKKVWDPISFTTSLHTYMHDIQWLL